MQVMEKQSELEFSLLCGTASFIATFASGIIHPLELIKTRFQSINQLI